MRWTFRIPTSTQPRPALLGCRPWAVRDRRHFTPTVAVCLGVVALAASFVLPWGMWDWLPGARPGEVASHVEVGAALLASLLPLLIIDRLHRPAPLTQLAVIGAVGGVSGSCAMLLAQLGGAAHCLPFYDPVNAAAAGAGMACVLAALFQIPTRRLPPGILTATMALLWILAPIAHWLATELAQAPPGRPFTWLPPFQAAAGRLPSLNGNMVAVISGFFLAAGLLRQRRLAARSTALTGRRITMAGLGPLLLLIPLLALAWPGSPHAQPSPDQPSPPGTVHARLLTGELYRPGEHHPLLLDFSGTLPDSILIEAGIPSPDPRAPVATRINNRFWKLTLSEPKSRELVPLFIPAGAREIRITQRFRTAPDQPQPGPLGREYTTTIPLPPAVIPRGPESLIAGVFSPNVESFQAIAGSLGESARALRLDPDIGWTWPSLSAFDVLVIAGPGTLDALGCETLVRWLALGGVAVADEVAASGIEAKLRSTGLFHDLPPGVGFSEDNAPTGRVFQVGAGRLFVSALPLADPTQPSLDALTTLLLRRGEDRLPAGPPLHLSAATGIFTQHGPPDFGAMAAQKHTDSVLLGLAAVGVMVLVLWLVLPDRWQTARYALLGAAGPVTFFVYMARFELPPPLVAHHTTVLSGHSGHGPSLVTGWVSVCDAKRMGMGSGLRPGAWATPLRDRWDECSLYRQPDGEWHVELGHRSLARIDWAVPDMSNRAAMAPLTGTISGNSATLAEPGHTAQSLPTAALGEEVRIRLGDHLSHAVAAHADQYGYARRNTSFAVIPVTPEDIGLTMPNLLGAPADRFAVATGLHPTVRPSGVPRDQAVPASPVDPGNDREKSTGIREIQEWKSGNGRSVTVISEWPAGLGLMWWPEYR